jgi:tetratricopeptide (TPR) repeat protein
MSYSDAYNRISA